MIVTGRTVVTKAILLIILSFFAFLVVMPFVLMIAGSLKTVAEINASSFSVFPKVPQFSNYYKGFSTASLGPVVLELGLCNIDNHPRQPAG